MNVHDDWTTEAFSLPPVAAATGPFAASSFLAAWWKERATHNDRAALVESATGLLPLVVRDARIEFAGEEDLVDYHTPLGNGIPELIAEFLASCETGTRFRFDSLPAEAMEPVAKGLALAGIYQEPVQHEVAAVLELPESFDDWLASIGKKERHEVRRKRRRFQDELGIWAIERVAGPEAVASFADMHRRASGEKGEFMTQGMEQFFTTLHSTAGAVIDVLNTEQGPVAAAFGFEDDEAYYLYNSAYEPAASHSSPGIVLLAALIESAISSGRSRFDFLKGDEPYKFRHGAEPRPLFVVEGTLP